MKIPLSNKRSALRSDRNPSLVTFRSSTGKRVSVRVDDLITVLQAIDRWPKPEPSPEHEYWEDVRSTANGWIEDVHSGNITGDINDALHELIDGSARVIYTYQAQMCVIYSRNDGEHIAQFGADGVVDGNAINWSRLAYSAFEADVREAIDALLTSALDKTLNDFDDCEAIRAAYDSHTDED